MPYLLDDKLVVGISGRAFFDLNKEHRVSDEQGLEASKIFQRKREKIPLDPGTEFPLVKSLLAINRKMGKPAIEVIVISRDDGDSGTLTMNSIADQQSGITRASFCGGRKVHASSNPYRKRIKRFCNCLI